jgi:hypothetical protein
VDVAGAQAIKLVAGVDHRLRFERRRRAVEIDAGIGQSRKLRAKVRRVECVHGIPRINTAIVAQFVGRDKASASVELSECDSTWVKEGYAEKCWVCVLTYYLTSHE